MWISMGLYAIAHLLPSYRINPHDTDVLWGWECFFWSTEYITSPFYNGFDLASFGFGVFVMMAHISVISLIIMHWTRSRRWLLAMILGIIGNLSNLWWLVKIGFEEGLPSLQVGYYVWVLASGLIYYAAFRKAFLIKKGFSLRQQVHVDTIDAPA